MNALHTELYENLKTLYPEILKPDEILHKSLKNYRKDKGYSLTYQAFKYLDDHKLYDFSKHDLESLDLQSRDLVLLEKNSTSLYYIGKKDIYISDVTHQVTISIIGLKKFLEALRY